ncbi:eukaryotic translation initiation factor 4E type 2 isoform X6 [Enhydra lutris kenyoni]|uniref:Eukaryotic translation initiation factor 4E type 2 isoform X6 n=1 Tax=Enhydra lutris kenyoni TaxID=391180 RepID=A0A2Y9JWI9_ENHLU|nr:eukaryotic translation initiation factor 4E type 2 isoform X6 [Enhydra lutris kenyoni]
MTVGTMIKMKKTAHRKMVRRKKRNETRIRAAVRGRLLCLDQQSIPCSTTILSGTPEGPLAVPPAHRAMNRISNRLAPLPPWSSSGGFIATWYDDANKNGGKWIIRLRKGLASRCWENLILAMLGEQFMVGEEICGAVVSVRFQEDIISIWNKTASDQATTARIRDTLRRVLNLPPNTIMEYKTHTDSIKMPGRLGPQRLLFQNLWKPRLNVP